MYGLNSWCDFFFSYNNYLSQASFFSSLSYFSWNRSAVSDSIIREKSTTLSPHRKFCGLYIEKSRSPWVVIPWQIWFWESRGMSGEGETWTSWPRRGGAWERNRGEKVIDLKRSCSTRNLGVVCWKTRMGGSAKEGWAQKLEKDFMEGNQ